MIDRFVFFVGCFLIQWLHRAGIWNSSKVATSLTYAIDMRWIPFAKSSDTGTGRATQITTLPMLGQDVLGPIMSPVGRFCVSTACRYWVSINHPDALIDSSPTRLRVLRDLHLARVPWSERHLLEQRRQFHNSLHALLSSPLEQASALMCHKVMYNPSVNFDFDVRVFHFVSVSFIRASISQI